MEIEKGKYLKFFFFVRGKCRVFDYSMRWTSILQVFWKCVLVPSRVPVLDRNKDEIEESFVNIDGYLLEKSKNDGM